jgi:hypothetical protein
MRCPRRERERERESGERREERETHTEGLRRRESRACFSHPVRKQTTAGPYSERRGTSKLINTTAYYFRYLSLDLRRQKKETQSNQQRWKRGKIEKI